MVDGYGFVNCPSLPGIHQLECLTWRPYGSPFDQVWAYFLGATPQLTKLDIIHSPIDRYYFIIIFKVIDWQQFRWVKYLLNFL